MKVEFPTDLQIARQARLLPMPEIAQPGRRIAGLHVFTFNEIEPTERWRREMLARLTPVARRATAE